MQVKTFLASALLTLSQSMAIEYLSPALSRTDQVSRDENHSTRQSDPWANPEIGCTGTFLDPNAPYQDNQDSLVQFFQNGGVIDDIWVKVFDGSVYLSEAFACRYGDANAPSDGSWQDVWGLIDSSCNINGQVGGGWARSHVIELTLGRTVYDESIC